jgi:hypothetical protein
VTSPTEELPETIGPAVQAPGSAILAVGADADGVESVAVWHVSPGGVPTGAWVRPQSEVLGSAAAAARLLALVERRALVGVSAEVLADWLPRWSAVAGLADSGLWWKKHLFSPVEAYDHIVRRRQLVAATVDAARETNKSMTPIGWAHDLVETAVGDLAALQAAAGIVAPPGSPVVSEALRLARVLRWLVVVWTEAEDVKGRRRVVRAAHGAAEPLPPAWLAAVRAAASTRLPL